MKHDQSKTICNIVRNVKTISCYSKRMLPPQKFKNQLAWREIRDKETGNKRNNFKLKSHTKIRYLEQKLRLRVGNR